MSYKIRTLEGPIDEKVFEETIKKAWCKETSVFPERWSEDKPYIGQCCATSFVAESIQEYKRRRELIINPDDHIWVYSYNIKPDGSRFEPTAEQKLECSLVIPMKGKIKTPEIEDITLEIIGGKADLLMKRFFYFLEQSKTKERMENEYKDAYWLEQPTTM